MNQFLDRLLKLKWYAKAAVSVGIMVAISLGYYFLLYGDLTDRITSAERHHEELKKEKTSYDQRRIEYLAYRNELNQLQEEQRELLKALPKKAEIPTFLAGIQEQAELAGLKITTFTVEREAPSSLYVKIPVRMEIRGTFHQIAKFFKNASEMRRIVNAENLSLIPDRAPGDQGNAPTRMKARFVAAVFRFVDKGVPPKP